MVYQEKFVVCIKSRGKILRECDGGVFIPFGEEYSILLKNLNSVKALVKITVDSGDVLDGNSLIINPNSETELQGFMKGSLAKNKFKFIKKTQEISDFRGDRIDDGIVRVEYWFEKYVEKKHIVTEHVHHYYNYYNCNYNCCWCSNWACPHRTSSLYRSSITSNGAVGSSSSTTSWVDNGSYNDGVSESFTSGGYDSLNVYNCNTLGNIGASVSKGTEHVKKRHMLQEQPVQDEGITVKGNEINQQFQYANTAPLEDNSRVIILKLIGCKPSGQIVREPITVKTKKQCPTCGRKSKSHLKYCANCGTFLE